MSRAPQAERSGAQDSQRLREVPGRIRRGQVKIRGAVHQGQDGKATGGLPGALPGLITALDGTQGGYTSSWFPLYLKALVAL